MTDEEAIKATQEGWAFVFQQGAMLALMPIEDWLDAMDRADTTGPILDPTAYRKYLYSGKGEIIKSVLTASLVFKRAILAAQKRSKRERNQVNPMPEEIPIPERWKEVARQCDEFIANPGAPSDRPVYWCRALIAELAEAEQRITIMQTNAADNYAAAEARAHKAEEKLEALQWKRITPETIFDKETYYLAAEPKRSNGFNFHTFEGKDFQRGAAYHLLAFGRTLYCAINPPTEQPEAEAGK